MEHKKIKELFAPYLDDMLSPEEKAAVERHLAECTECRKELVKIKEIVSLIGLLPDLEPPYDLAAKVKAELKHERKSKGFFAGANLRSLGIAAAFILMIGISYVSSQAGMKQGDLVQPEPSASRGAEYNISAQQSADSGNANDMLLAPKLKALEESRERAPEAPDIAANQAQPYAAQSKAASQEISLAPKIIRSADMALKVNKYEDFIKSLEGYLQKTSGYVENSSLNKNTATNRYSATLVVRVPEKSFQPALDYLKTLGEPERVNINSNDVTTQYIDTDARIKALKSQIDTLQGLLEKAKTVEEMLKIQQELTRVLGEHDSLVSQNKYLDRAVAYSTIVIMVDEQEVPKDKIVSNQEKDIFSLAKAGFIRSINSVIKTAQQTFVGFVTILPQILLVLAALAIVMLAVKIKKKK